MRHPIEQAEVIVIWQFLLIASALLTVWIVLGGSVVLWAMLKFIHREEMQ